MKKVKVMTIFGTRPEAIKMAPLVKELSKDEAIESVVCVTAQHRQMLDQVLRIFKITPQYDLNIMQEKQTLAHITSKVLQGLIDIINDYKRDPRTATQSKNNKNGKNLYDIIIANLRAVGISESDFIKYIADDIYEYEKPQKFVETLRKLLV